jgi:hypothetical protein
MTLLLPKEMAEAKHPILAFKEEFFKRLEAKNGWGKNEVKDLFLNTVLDVTFKPIVDKHYPTLKETPMGRVDSPAQETDKEMGRPYFGTGDDDENPFE